jgi:SAM-dependent methyltransferase
MREILDEFPANAGYLHVALRALALQGWLTRLGTPASLDLNLEVTKTGEIAAESFATYAEVGEFVYSGVPIDEVLFANGNALYAHMVDRCRQSWNLLANNGDPHRQAVFATIRNQLDGLLAGPLMIALKRRGLLEGEYFPLAEFNAAQDNLSAVLRLLHYLEWVEPKGGAWQFTQLGRFACGFSLHYGLTLSYWPLYCKLPKLIFGLARNVTHGECGVEETHVDRVLNVLASGIAHRRYFEDSDGIIVQIFNREPLREQPKFVADMGCGDGAWLQRIFQVVRDRTLRGKNLTQYPLTMIGADFNAKSIEVAQSRLREAGVPGFTLFGDITNPDQFAVSLLTHGFDCRDGLHIRAFIDHNRQYITPQDTAQALKRRSLSTGAYADQDGGAIANHLVEQNLVEHFRKWASYAGPHGLIIIEAHNIHPTIAAKYSGKIHATAFDTYHGFSNQYPVDFEAFMQAAEEAGLRPSLYQQRIYPSRLPCVGISVNHFKSADPTVLVRLGTLREPTASAWQPARKNSRVDGEALHRFLYRDGDITRPASWCFSATAVLIRLALDAVEWRIEQCLAGKNGRNITVLDFGAGTGLATIELIEGLDEKGLLQKMERESLDFKLLLFDLPSDWFAKAYELLSRLPFVEFHSLRNSARGEIRQVTDQLDGESVDIIVASMVLHLLPPKVMPTVFASLAAVLKAGGTFIWNTPDTTPSVPEATVIHTANRALREAISAVLDGDLRLDVLLASLPATERARYADVTAALKHIQQDLTPERRRKAKAAGAMQILPVPTDASVIHGALSSKFLGEISTLISALREDELLSLALLPANQRFFSEIEDPYLRERCTELLLRHEIVPRLRAGPAGHPAGINLQWHYGSYVKA